MRRTTVKTGLTVISAGMALIMTSMFCHTWFAGLLALSAEGETRLIIAGLFLGGLCGGLGVVVTVAGLYRVPGGQEVRLFPVLLLLALVVLLFYVLFSGSMEQPREPRRRPGETIII